MILISWLEKQSQRNTFCPYSSLRFIFCDILFSSLYYAVLCI